MEKIQIRDLPLDRQISKEEMKAVFGKDSKLMVGLPEIKHRTVGHILIQRDPSEKLKIDPRAMPDNTDTCW